MLPDAKAKFSTIQEEEPSKISKKVISTFSKSSNHNKLSGSLFMQEKDTNELMEKLSKNKITITPLLSTTNGKQLKEKLKLIDLNNNLSSNGSKEYFLCKII